MESPILIHEKYKRIDNIERVAYERLFENYLVLKLKGSKKLIEIDSTDQESVLYKFSHGYPIPGMIYTFIHVNNDTLLEIQNYKTGKNVTFHDLTPILFCTSFNPKTYITKGLNLNMLPKEERLKFIQAFWEYYKIYFEKVEERTEYNKPAYNREYFIVSNVGKNPELFEYFNKKQNAMFNYAYRSYKLKNIRNLRMIEYEEWAFIPFFDARNSFKQANLDEIYKTYWLNKRNIKT